MTIAQALKLYPAKIESDILLAHVLKQPKEFLYCETDQKLTKPQEIKFKALAKKRLAGVPVAYLLGYKYFHGLKFIVNRSVLIPRPESEWLVDWVIKLAKPKSKILDVGTGSGCLAVSIAKSMSKAEVTAIDISPAAIKTAEQNAKLNKTRVEFIRSNLLENTKGRFDVIVVNLPYVPSSDYKKLRVGLQYEPRLALTDGTDRFIIIERLLQQASKQLLPDGIVLLEIDPKAKSVIKKTVKQTFPNSKLEFYKDIRGLVRYAAIK